MLRLIASPRELLDRGLGNEFVDRELERVRQLKQGDRERAKEKEAEQDRLKELAASFLQKAPSDFEKALVDLKVSEFEAVVALAIADDDQVALGILAGYATRQATNSKKWRGRLQRIEQAMGSR